MNISIKKICVNIIVVTSCILMIACGEAKGSTALIENLQIPDFAHDTPTGEITADALVKQNFVSHVNEISQIELYGATYMRTNKGLVNITLTDSQNTLIASWQLEASQFMDNTKISLDMNGDAHIGENAITGAGIVDITKNKKLKGKELAITISSPDGIPGSSVTFWTTQEDVYPDGCVNIGGYDWYNDLWFNVY